MIDAYCTVMLYTEPLDDAQGNIVKTPRPTPSQHKWKEERTAHWAEEPSAVLSGCWGAESHLLHTQLPAERSHCVGNNSARLINTNCEAERTFPGTRLHSQAGSTCCMRKRHSYSRPHTNEPSFRCRLILQTEMNSFKCLPFCVQLPTMETCIYLEDIMLIWIDTSTTSGNLLQVNVSY